MIKRIQFSISYALHNILRDRQRTAFALFSIAAGVATVVALRMLGIMLTDALTSNAQALMRGDIMVTTQNKAPRISIVESGPHDYPFTAANTPQFDRWAAQHNAQITYAVTSELMQTAVVNGDQAGTPSFAVGYFIDPKVYPFYNIVRAEDPAGASLDQLLNGPNRVVLGRRLANQLSVHVGDKMRVGSAPELQTVSGIVSEGSEANFNSFLNVIFGFVYIDRANMQSFGLPAGSADTAFIRLPEGQDPPTIAAEISNEWGRPAGSRWRVDNVTRVLKNNTVSADLISRFVLLLSLVALIIGGVGIVNTLLVSVNRRSAEIAVLKTLGLQGGSVGLLFLSEAVILGFVGSMLGLLLGLLLSIFARDFGQQAFAVILPWRFSLEPLAIGLALGMFITVLFSLLPTFMAAQVRPSLVLRQGNIPLARAGCLPGLISLIVLLAGVSYISEAIIGSSRNVLQRFANLPYGLIGTLAVFFMIMFMLALVWLVVWFLGRLPSFRNPSLRIAIRALTQHRARTSLSLLALIVGMTALSWTLIMTRSISVLLQTSLTEPLGGNVIVLPLLPISNGIIKNRLDTVPGVEGYRDVRIFQAELVAVDGDRNFLTRLIDPNSVNSQIVAEQLNLVLGVDVHGNLARGTLAAGRFLNDSDQGTTHLVVPNRPELAAIGVHVGSKFTYNIRGQERNFEVVGLVDPDPRLGLIPFSLGDSAVQAPLDAARSAVPFDIMIATVKPDAVNSVMAAVGATPGVFVFDLSIFDSIISRLLNQLAALPLLVAGLSLFAATVLIATTVSLATMERRRQIAILKAMGVTRRQALSQLLIENAIVGAVGGLISLLPTFIVLAAVPALTQNLVQLPVPVDLILLMLTLSIGITLVATLITAWSASSEKPLEALRYE